MLKPPVGPDSPRWEIEAWLAALDQMRVEYADQAEALTIVERSQRAARAWLTQLLEREGRRGRGR